MRRHAELLFVLIFSIFAAAAALAHGPTPQRAEEKIEIAAPPAKVWAALKDFGDVKWHPGIVKADASGGSDPGATRTITLATGGELAEGLDEYSEEEMTYGYRLSKENLEAFPVSFYSAKITVAEKDGGSEVTWIGRFYRADTGNFPPEHLNDEAAMKAMTEFMQQGLRGLKAEAESQG